MLVRHITHPSLNPDEYYFCYFQTQDDINNFGRTIEFPDIGEELSISPGDKCIIQAHHQTISYTWYEKLDPIYFKRDLDREINAKIQVLNEAQGFFG